MAIVTAQNFLEPFTILLRKGTQDDPYRNITETIKLVPGISLDATDGYNVAILREIPLLSQGVTATVGETSLTEIRDNSTVIDSTHFKVDYTGGRVYLSRDYDNDEVTFGYKGRGAILVNSERILLSYGNDLDYIYTLDNYIRDHMGEANIGDLSTLKTTAKDKVVNAINEVYDDIHDHIDNTSNPHSVTKAQVGLGNVNNTSDANKPVSTAQQTALNTLNTNIRNDMNTADGNLQEQINALQGAYIYIGTINLPTSQVTQTNLTARAREIMGTETLQTGWVLLDNDKHEWYYNGEITTWIDMEQANVYPATNTTMGIVKGGDYTNIIDGNITVTLSDNASKLGNQLPSYYGKASDVDAKLPKAGGTMTGKLILFPANATTASLNIPTATAAVTNRGEGDFWKSQDGSLYIRKNDANARICDSVNSPTASLETISQSEAEGGISTTTRAWTSQRVKQAIDARAWTNDTLVVGPTEPSPISGRTILWIDTSE